jgi:hypothetical protein
MPTIKDLELFKAAYKTVKDILRIKKDENLLITIDSISDFRVAEEMAKAGEALGAKVMVAWHTTPKGYGKATDPPGTRHRRVTGRQPTPTCRSLSLQHAPRPTHGLSSTISGCFTVHPGRGRSPMAEHGISCLAVFQPTN